MLLLTKRHQNKINKLDWDGPHSITITASVNPRQLSDIVWVPSPGNSSHSVLHCILVLSPVDCILAVTRVWHGDPLYVGNGKRWGWFSGLGDIFNKGSSKYTWCVLPLSNKWCPKNVSDQEGSELNLFCPLLPWYSKRTNSGWGPFLGASEQLSQLY